MSLTTTNGRISHVIVLPKQLRCEIPLIPPEVITSRFEKLVVDVVGPFPKSKHNFRYILTAMDLATGFPFAYPMRGFNAEETALNLLSIFSFIGSPLSILSDQGSNFLSRVLSFVYDKFGVLRIKTSPYHHPESNGTLSASTQPLKL